jgi:hypothetical protein
MQMSLVLHSAWKGGCAKFEPVLMIPADFMAVARQAKKPIRSKSSTLETAGLDLTSGPQPLRESWETGKYVVKSFLA